MHFHDLQGHALVKALTIKCCGSENTDDSMIRQFICHALLVCSKSNPVKKLILFLQGNMSGREEVSSNDKSPAKRQRKVWTAVATGSLSV